MNKDIENIDTYETRTKVNTTKWMPINEVIYKAYLIGSKIFSGDLLKNVRIIQNKARDITREVKNNIKQMATEQVLYMHEGSCYVKRI